MSESDTSKALTLIEKAVYAASGLVCSMPEKAAAMLGTSLGLMLWKFDRKDVAETCDKIDRVYNRLNKKLPMAPELIVKKACIHFSLVLCELLRYPILKGTDLSRKFCFHGQENMEKAREAGKGTVLALPHIGNWEYLGAAIVNSGYRLNSFYLAQKDNGVGKALDHFREYSGIVLHDRDRGGIKALRALKNNEFLGMITDQDGNSNGVYTDFLGHWVSMPAGPANWTLKTGSALLPIYSLRRGFTFNYDAYFLEKFEDETAADRSERVINRTVKLAKWMEDLILTYPHQYLWFYDRFRPRHEGYLYPNIISKGAMLHGTSRYGK